MKRLFTIVMMFWYSIVLHAQGTLPKAILKDLPSDYKCTETRVISSDNEKTIEGIVTFSLPQKNKCFGADSGYITVSYKYFSKLNIPNANEIANKKAVFDNGTKNNHKEVVKNIPLGLLNTHDKEYIGCSELSFGIHDQIHYYHYFTNLKCKGYAYGVTAEIMEQKVIEYQYDLPESVKSQLISDYQYSNIYITARADKELNKKDISIIFYGTFTYDEAFNHTKRLMDLFLSFDFEKITSVK